MSFQIDFSKRKLQHLLAIAFLFSIVSKAQYMNPPGVDWKKVTFRDKTMKNQSGVTQANSADEWWYSHKNLYNSTGELIGYIAVGYIAEVVNSADKTQIETDMRDVYNEGSNSPYNPYGSGSLFTNTQANGLPGCDDLYNVMAAQTDTNLATDAINRKTEHRGMVARIDLKGNMVWCRIPVISGEGLQEVVQVGDYVYVVGTHYGVKSNWTSSGSKSFIPYNKTSSNPSSVFDATLHGISAGQSEHLYIGKYDLNGTKIWEGLFGHQSFYSPSTPSQAYYTATRGRDILHNTFNNTLYAVGRTTGFANTLFVVAVDSNGIMVNEAVLPKPTGANSHSQSADVVEGNSICQTHATGTMAVGGCVSFANPGSTTPAFDDWYRGILYSINPDLTLNNGTGAWTAANPYVFPAANTTPTYGNRGTGYQRTSNIWDINPKSGGEILVGLLDDCYSCIGAGHNRAWGKILRVNGQTGAISTSYGNMQAVNAYDLRLGVIETADGGYAAVSSRRNSVASWPSLSAIGVFSTCPWYSNIGNASNDPWAGAPDGWGVWDTDPVIRKFDNSNNLQWEWSEDVVPGRTRELTPGDLKRQECMYKITETPDKSLVISGNCSYNHDDNYMVKLFSDCNANVNYSHIYTTPATISGTIATSQTIQGVIALNNTLTIKGNTTKLKFADSRLTGVPSYIVVNPGGKLIIQDGAEITSIDNSVCPQSMWDGIYVSGTSSLTQGTNYSNVVNQGFLTINSATLSNARNAITTGDIDAAGNFKWNKTGGVIYAQNSDFINNHRDVQYMYYQNPSSPNMNLGLFTNCRFLTNSVLNEGIPTGHVSMYNVFNVRFKGCEFAYNAGTAYSQEKHGYGIYSIDATYKIEDLCTNSSCSSPVRSKFTNLANGIMVANTNPLRAVNVDHAIFSDVHQGTSTLPRHGLVLSSANTSKVTRNNFTETYNDYGIYVNNSQNYAINSNTLNGVGYYSNSAGIIASESFGGSHRIYRNQIEDFQYGIQSQYANSAYQTSVTPPALKADGLLINCDRMYDGFWDIWLTGDVANGVKYGCIAQTQGFLTNNSNPNPKMLVRNWYTASCSGFAKQYEADNTMKTIEHAAHSNTNTRPLGSCGNTYLDVKNSGIAYDFEDHCPDNDIIQIDPNCNCPGCCVYADVANAMSAAQGAYNVLKAQFESEIDGGDTDGLIEEMGEENVDVVALLVEHSPYLSDEVLIAFISNTANSASDILDVIGENKPVSQEVWEEIVNRGFNSTIMEDFEDLQNDYPVSQRDILENEYARARADFEFICGQKLNYFLTDTLESSRDSALAVILENIDLLNYGKRLAPRAYAGAGYFDRAFEFADSLANIPEFEEAMEIEMALMALDTASKGVYKILEDAILYETISEFASDSTKPGTWQARAVLYHVYGSDMKLKHLQADIGGERLANHQADTPAQESKETINEQYVGKFFVFPNPASHEVNFRYEAQKNQEYNVRVTDAIGRIVMERKTMTGNTESFSTELLDNGIYFINLVESGRIVAAKKLIVEK